jgi:hypothetical protein
MNFPRLMYYRFAHDFNYASFEIICQKVSFGVLFISLPPEFFLAPIHHLPGIDQCKGSNHPFSNMECLFIESIIQKCDYFQIAPDYPG